MVKKLFTAFFITLEICIGAQVNIFWEKEDILNSGNIGRFETVANGSLMGTAFADTLDKFSLYFKFTHDSYKWSENILIVNKYFSNTPYGDDFSIDIDKDNNLFVCYRSGEKSFIIEKIPYPYRQVQKTKLFEINQKENIYLPKIKIDSNNDIVLTYVSNKDNIFFIEFKKISKAGQLLFEDVIGRHLKRSALNPSFIEKDGLYLMAFQAKEESVLEGYYYNIYLAYSNDAGRTWKYLRPVTSKGENNQGPSLYYDKGICHLVWEKEDRQLRTHVYYKAFDLAMKDDRPEKMISYANSDAHGPVILNINNIINVFWYDDKSGIYLNYYTQIINYENFSEKPIGKNRSRTLRNFPVVFKDQLKFFWVETSQNANTLFYLKTDTFVQKPKAQIKGLNAYGYLNKNEVAAQWEQVQDISGIKSYKAVLTKNADEVISKDEKPINYYELSRTFLNKSDGEWFFKILAVDNALNESETAVYPFRIDTTPPKPPKFVNVEYDGEGGLKTNSPKIEWSPDNEKLSSYLYVYKFFINESREKADEFMRKALDRDFIATKDNNLNFENLDNGTLLIGIKGYDEAGNLSQVNWEKFKLNDYVAVTLISNIVSKILPSGDNVFEISGRGFQIDGEITHIYIDRNKKAPFDHSLNGDSFRVISDKYIMQTKEIQLDDGIYYIGVEHPVRGTVFYKYPSEFSGEWVFKNVSFNKFIFDRVIFFTKKINMTYLMFLGGGIIWVLIVLLILNSIIRVIQDKIRLKSMMEELEEIKERLSDQDYIARREKMVKKGIGLTLKYTILIISLVITIVTATSFTLSYRALRNETKVLANEMKERGNIIMINYESLVRDNYEFSDLPFPRVADNMNMLLSLPDIGFVFFKENESGGTIVKETPDAQVFFKKEKYKDLTSSKKETLIKELVLNDRMNKAYEEYSKSYNNNTLIWPDFNPLKLSEGYMLIRPIFLLDKDKKQTEYIGEIAIGYSYKRMINEINNERIKMIQVTFIVTLIAIMVSVFGAIFLATTTIRPIKRMSKHVNIISSTEDYEKLVGTENEKIDIRSKDEIGLLASSINDMTVKLIEKAKSDKQLMLGKEIQKKFIPLEPHTTDYIDIFGFYEGAKGVSGDYFDYKKLDEDHYAFIICDVAGKAVPAALIMVQISTIFHSFFSNFNPKRNKIETVTIVNTINDTVAEREFAGRFAAILIFILNVKTGKMILTNAGYTQVLVYRDGKKRAEWIKLNPDSGAAGIFPISMLPHPYVQEELTINKGDIIYLFTDGIEESRNGRKIKMDNGQEKMEDFGLERLKKNLDMSSGRTPKEMIEELIADEKSFRGSIEQYDDLTIMGIKRK